MRTLSIAYGDKADSKRWPQLKPDPQWPSLLEWLDLEHPARVKDCGGYVAGLLDGEQRRKGNVVSRSVLVLDADYAEKEFRLSAVTILDSVAHAGHTTWRHTDESARYRLIIPLSRDVKPDEYKRLAWAVMNEIGASQFDLTTTQAERFMYRPSTQDRQIYEWWVEEGEFLNVDKWLASAPEPDEPEDEVEQEIEPEGDVTQATRDKAIAVLEKACRETEEGLRFAGRNDACIHWLPILYRFALHGSIDRDTIDDAIWQAVQEAPGDHDFTGQEYHKVATSAWEYASADGPANPVVDDPLEDLRQAEERIFESTSTLKHVERAAHSAGRNSGSVLAAVLARVIAEIPPHHRLPGAEDGVVGSRASLDLAFALVGKSGRGKSDAERISEQVLGIDQSEIQKSPSTGQGLMQSYLYENKDLKENVMVEDPRRLFNVDEIGQLASLKDDKSATIGHTLRSMLTGGHVGSENATRERRRNLPARSYRMALIAGVQPTRSGTLLNDEDAGLPQRFVWVVVDKTLSPEPGNRPEWPGSLNWEGIPDRSEFDDDLVIIDYPEHIREQVIWDDYEDKEDEGVSRSHLNLTRLKVAAALMFLHGEERITERWWDIAGRIMEESLVVQRHCRSVIAQEAQERENRRAVMQGVAEEVREESVIVRKAQRMEQRVLEAGGEWLTRRQALPAKRDRDREEEILAVLGRRFEVEQYDGKRGLTWKVRAV